MEKEEKEEEMEEEKDEKDVEYFEEILEEIGGKRGMNKKIIIREFKRELLKMDKDEYNRWQSSNFDFNYVFYGKYNLLESAIKLGVIEMAKAIMEQGGC